MNKFLYLLLLYSSYSYCQKVTTSQFIYENDTLMYKRIDYSKNGLGAMYISMYEDTEFNSLVPGNAAECLEEVQNLYHTFYYFLPVPKKYTKQQREKIFSELVAHLKKTENTSKLNLFLNFDKNYSALYLSENEVPKDESSVKRILIDLDPYNICKGLITKFRN